MEVRFSETKITSPKIVADVLNNVLKLENELDREKEHFWVIGLKSNNLVKFIELVTLGTLNASLVHPREVFRPAIFRGVDSIVIAHNHPSGEANPSKEDKAITTRLVEAGKLLDIPILDHVIIINDGNYYSFKEDQLI
jgi:DNA repair protein RadC